MVSGSVVIADDRGTADGIAKKDGSKYKVSIHDRAVGGHTVFSGKFHKLQVIHGTDDRVGKICHQLGGAVGTGLEQNFSIKMCFAQMEDRFFAACKIEYREEAADQLAAGGSNGCSRNAPAKHSDKQVVKNNIGDAGDNDHGKSKFWFFCGNKKALEGILQHKWSQCDKAKSAIDRAVTEKLTICPQKPCHGGSQGDTGNTQEHAAKSGNIYQHGEILTCFLFFSFPQSLCDDGTSSGTHHKSQGR